MYLLSHLILCCVSVSTYALCYGHIKIWAVLGKMFRVKLDLPEWKADEDIARHLLKLACEPLCLTHLHCTF